MKPIIIICSIYTVSVFAAFIFFSIKSKLDYYRSIRDYLNG